MQALDKASTMSARDAVSGGLGKCIVTIDGNNYVFANLIKIEASVEKTKTEVPILGRTGKGHKSSGWEGTGSMTLHYNQDVLRKYMQNYNYYGTDFYFNIQIEINDPTTNVGKQIVTLKDCNVDSIMVANLDADAEYLEEDVDFTFDDFEIKQYFEDPQVNGGGFNYKLTKAGMEITQSIGKGLSIFGDVSSGISSITGALG